MAPRRRRLYAVAASFGIVFIALTAWIGVRAVLARGHLLAARDAVTRLQAEVSAGDVSGLPSGLAHVQAEARAADRLTGDPVWSGLAKLPSLGKTLDVTHRLASSVHQLAEQALNPLVDASRLLDPDKLRSPEGSINLQLLSRAAPDLVRAASALHITNSRVAHIDTGGALGVVADARTQFAGQLHGLVGTVDTASRAATAGPDMLGLHGPRRYLMVFQTPAESRGTGGLVGSYAIIRAENGKLTRERTGSNSDLIDSATPVVNLGPEFNTRYARTYSAYGWKNANYTPHFPYAARIWQRLWEKQSGQRIDGVLAVDPIALGYFLDVTGAVTLSDGEVISGANAATWSMVTEYAKYPLDNDRRKELSTELAKKMLDQLTSGTGGSAGLLRALGRAAGERRLLAWSARPAEEKQISGTPLAGEWTSPAGPFTALVVRNGGGDKLDYYVSRRLDYQVLSCGKQGRVVQVTATLTNGAPRTGLPDYVTVRSDGRKVPVGQNRLLADIYATRGSVLNAVWINGEPSKAVVVATERGLPVYEADLELPIGEPQTFQVQVTEPVSKTGLSYLVQPLVNPLTLTTRLSCP